MLVAVLAFQVDANVEITANEPTNAATEAGKSHTAPDKASVNVEQGPAGSSEPSQSQQQGLLKKVLSRLPFLPSKKQDLEPPQAGDSSRNGTPIPWSQPVKWKSFT